MGEEITFLGLINSKAPENELNEKEVFSVDTEIRIIKDILREGVDVESLVGLNDIDLIWPTFLEFIKNNDIGEETIRKAFPNELVKRLPDINKLSFGELIYFANIYRTMKRARKLYIPDEPIKAKICFFEAAEDKIENKDIWYRYSHRGIEIHCLEGTHISMLESPWVCNNAKIINRVVRYNHEYIKNL